MFNFVHGDGGHKECECLYEVTTQTGTGLELTLLDQKAIKQLVESGTSVTNVTLHLIADPSRGLVDFMDDHNIDIH